MGPMTTHPATHWDPMGGQTEAASYFYPFFKIQFNFLCVFSSQATFLTHFERILSETRLLSETHRAVGTPPPCQQHISGAIVGIVCWIVVNFNSFFSHQDTHPASGCSCAARLDGVGFVRHTASFQRPLCCNGWQRSQSFADFYSAWPPMSLHIPPGSKIVYPCTYSTISTPPHCPHPPLGGVVPRLSFSSSSSSSTTAAAWKLPRRVRCRHPAFPNFPSIASGELALLLSRLAEADRGRPHWQPRFGLAWLQLGPAAAGLG